MLRDIEELLLRVRDPMSRAYIREAVQCYAAGAYRACVTLAMAACMDDLRRKLGTLATSGAGAAVTTAHGIVEAEWNAQRAYESMLLDQAKAIDLISPDEEKKLRALLSIRHLCAHPSGHAGSPEEARSAVADSIELVMSRPPQLGGREIESLLGRITNANFFPSNGSGASVAASTSGAVRNELERVQPRAMARLASRLGEVITTEPAGTSYDNAVRFLGEMALLERSSNERPAWRTVESLIVSTISEARLLDVFTSAAGALGSSETDLHRQRALTLVRRRLSSLPQARSVARAWRTAGVLTETEVAEFLAVLASETLKFGRLDEAHIAIGSASEIAQHLDWPEYMEAYLSWLVSALSHPLREFRARNEWPDARG